MNIQPQPGLYTFDSAFFYKYMTSLRSFIPSTAIVLYGLQACDDGWSSKSLAEASKYLARATECLLCLAEFMAEVAESLLSLSKSLPEVSKFLAEVA